MVAAGSAATGTIPAGETIVLKAVDIATITGGTTRTAAKVTVNGQGADYDTLVASARAYVNALNKLLVKREKTAPAALSA